MAERYDFGELYSSLKEKAEQNKEAHRAEVAEFNKAITEESDERQAAWQEKLAKAGKLFGEQKATENEARLKAAEAIAARKATDEARKKLGLPAVEDKAPETYEAQKRKEALRTLSRGLMGNE